MYIAKDLQFGFFLYKHIEKNMRSSPNKKTRKTNVQKKE